MVVWIIAIVCAFLKLDSCQVSFAPNILNSSPLRGIAIPRLYDIFIKTFKVRKDSNPGPRDHPPSVGSAQGPLSSNWVIYESRTLKKLPHDDAQWWIFKRTGHYEFDILLKKLFLKSKNDCHARKVTKICPWFRGRVVVLIILFFLCRGFDAWKGMIVQNYHFRWSMGHLRQCHCHEAVLEFELFLAAHMSFQALSKFKVLHGPYVAPL